MTKERPKHIDKCIKFRSVKYLLLNSKDIDQLWNDWREALRKCHRLLYKYLKNADLDVIKLSKKRLKEKLQNNGWNDIEIKKELSKYDAQSNFLIPHSLYDKFIEICYSHGFKSKPHVKSLVKYITERYKSKKNRKYRRDKYKKLILKKTLFKNKSPHFNELIFFDLNPKDKYGTILIKGCDIKSKYKYCNSTHSKTLLNFKSFGGNLTRKFNKKTRKYDYFFCPLITVEDDWLYKPTTVIAFDINKDKYNYIVLSNGIKIIRPDSLDNILLELHECAIKRKHSYVDEYNNKLTSKQRSYYQWRAKELITRLKIELDVIANTISDIAIKEQAVIGIDMCSAGGKIGSFGGEIRNVLLKKLEDKKIPFCLCPTEYTSQTCPYCDKRQPDARNKSKGIYICGQKGCSHFNIEQDDQMVGALNNKNYTAEKWGVLDEIVIEQIKKTVKTKNKKKCILV